MFLFLVTLSCLFPLSLYCLYMAMLHQRPQPTMISGPWDFAAVLAALSGFLLIGGSLLVFSIHTAVRDAWLLTGSFHDLRSVHAQASTLTFVIWGLYFAALVGGSAYLIWSRRSCTILYQINPVELEGLLTAALDRLNLPFERRGSRWLVGLINQSLTMAAKVMDGPRKPSEKGVFHMDGSTAMREVTLRWQYATGTVRDDVEAELARDLAAYAIPASPASTWFMTAAGSLFLIMVFLLATFLMVAFRR